jgi:hypothetical protein
MNMAITDTEIQKAFRIKRCVKEFFDTHIKTEVEAKELMPLFIKKGIFLTNSQNGIPIQDFLKHLEKLNYLNLIPQALYKQKNTNKKWFFIRPTNTLR